MGRHIWQRRAPATKNLVIGRARRNKTPPPVPPLSHANARGLDLLDPPDDLRRPGHGAAIPASPTTVSFARRRSFDP